MEPSQSGPWPDAVGSRVVEHSSSLAKSGLFVGSLGFVKNCHCSLLNHHSTGWFSLSFPGRETAVAVRGKNSHAGKKLAADEQLTSG